MRQDCPCPNTKCSRFTLCDECEASRVRQGKLPFCQRPKRTLLDRIRKMLGMNR
ncbi:MAG: hypothetical protein WCX22_03930 [Methanoregula sp.]